MVSASGPEGHWNHRFRSDAGKAGRCPIPGTGGKVLPSDRGRSSPSGRRGLPEPVGLQPDGFRPEFRSLSETASHGTRRPGASGARAP